MARITDGGPAFPLPAQHNGNGDQVEGAPGMNLLDWFAGQALAGWVNATVTADPAQLAEAAKTEGYSGSVDGYLALRSYRTAKAMLAESERVRS